MDFSPEDLFGSEDVANLEFGRRGEGACERLQKVGQSQTHCSANRLAAQLILQAGQMCLRAACGVREWTPINSHFNPIIGRNSPHSITHASQQTGNH